MKEVVLDGAAFIALERGEPAMRGYVLLADQGHVALTTSSAVVAQVWRGGGRQVPMDQTRIKARDRATVPARSLLACRLALGVA